MDGKKDADYSVASQSEDEDDADEYDALYPAIHPGRRSHEALAGILPAEHNEEVFDTEGLATTSFIQQPSDVTLKQEDARNPGQRHASLTSPEHNVTAEFEAIVKNYHSRSAEPVSEVPTDTELTTVGHAHLRSAVPVSEVTTDTELTTVAHAHLRSAVPVSEVPTDRQMTYAQALLKSDVPVSEVPTDRKVTYVPARLGSGEPVSMDPMLISMQPLRDVRPSTDLRVSVDPAHIELQTVGLHSMEQAIPPASAQEDREEFECTRLGRFNFIGTAVGGRILQLCATSSTYSRTKRVLAIMALVAAVSLVLGIIVFSVSFRFVEYYQIALCRNRVTGVVDRDRTLYPGCYVLGPNTELLYFDTTSQNIAATLSVFTADTLVIDVDVSMQYFLRPEEVGKLHAKLGQDYHEVLELLVLSTVKNESPNHSLEQYRLGRVNVERKLHQVVTEKLRGTCCPRCCPGDCDNKTVCSSCQPAEACDEAYHVDVDYFQLGKIQIPDRVFERFMRQTILQIETERELFIQTHAVVLKETDRQAQHELNAASEILANATAHSDAIGSIEQSRADMQVQKSYMEALKSMYNTLGVATEEHKLSVMMIRAYKDIEHNLYSYQYDKQSLGGY